MEAMEYVPSRPGIARMQGQDKIKKTRENNAEKTEKVKSSSHRVITGDKSTIPKSKGKTNPPELSAMTALKALNLPQHAHAGIHASISPTGQER